MDNLNRVRINVCWFEKPKRLAWTAGAARFKASRYDVIFKTQKDPRQVVMTAGAARFKASRYDVIFNRKTQGKSL